MNGDPAGATAGAVTTAASPVDRRRRLFDDAQREADTVFAQYQLSQLIALGGELPAMASAVISELVRDSDAVAGALWLAAPGEGVLQLAADESAGPPADEGTPRRAPGGAGRPGAVPTRFASAAAAEEWARRSGWHGVALDERRDLEGGDVRMVGFLALCPGEETGLPADRIRLLALVRHELAIAFRAAQLREALAGEQALLAAILDGARDAIVAVDDRRQVVRVNAAATALLGGPLSRQRTLTCREALGCGPVRGSDGAGSEERLRCGPRCRFEEVMAGPARLVECEQLVVARDGSEVPVAASYSFMPGPGTGAVAVLRDLRAERAVEELRASFLAAVSHELRTPLSLIAGYVDSLLDLDLDPEEQRRSVERIGHAAGRLTELVHELLELTDFERGGRALQRSRVHLPTVVARLVGEIAESPGMRPVHVMIPSDLPAVDIDAVRIGHVLANLVDNAQKYGEGPITVMAARAGAEVVVSVRDQGPGIPPDERTRVFDRFYRGRAVPVGIAGSGLGLYVCRRLVEAHGGRIWIDTKWPGSAISFSIPVAVDPPSGERGASS